MPVGGGGAGPACILVYANIGVARLPALTGLCPWLG